MTALRTILVPVDGSLPSLAALDLALALAVDYDATVELLHVIPPPDTLVPIETDASLRFLDDALDRARDVIGDRASHRTVVGEPLREIVAAAGGGFDLIVMGTHGRTGRLHSLLGSVAEGVVRNAPCPVLTVRDPGHGYQSFAERIHNRPSLAEQVEATR